MQQNYCVSLLRKSKITTITYMRKAFVIIENFGK